TRYTASQIGSSTPARRASATTPRAAGTPSTTIGVERSTSSSARPRPSSSPAQRLRLWRLVQVAMRSPTPASPATVAGCPPQAATSRPSSARLRVSRAAFPLSPAPRPSPIPAARAITFLAAPHSSTPTTSALVYRRKAGVAASGCSGAGDDRRRRQARGHLLGVRRPGQRRDVAAERRSQGAQHHFTGPLPGALDEPLGADEQQRLGLDERC